MVSMLCWQDSLLALSQAPKIRAMDIIDELEPDKEVFTPVLSAISMPQVTMIHALRFDSRYQR